MLDMYKGVANSPETTITNNINETDTIIYVLDETRIPELPNLMVLGTGTSAETVKVLEIEGNAITVERGFQGIPRAWNAGTIIARNFTEYDYNALVENVKTLKGNTDINADEILSLMNHVGNLENLDTVEKSNIVLALNEIYQDLVAHKADIASQELGKGASKIGIHDAGNKFTATNVEGALNELFTNVSNGKNLVGGAITGVDGNIIIPTDPTFQQLADAIGQISTGRKFAEGTITSISAKLPFALNTGSSTPPTVDLYYVNVDNLSFHPSILILWRNSGYGFDITLYLGTLTNPKQRIIVNKISRASNNETIFFNIQDVSPVAIGNSFLLPICSPGDYRWLAFE